MARLRCGSGRRIVSIRALVASCALPELTPLVAIVRAFTRLSGGNHAFLRIAFECSLSALFFQVCPATVVQPQVRPVLMIFRQAFIVVHVVSHEWVCPNLRHEKRFQHQRVWNSFRFHRIETLIPIIEELTEVCAFHSKRK